MDIRYLSFIVCMPFSSLLLHFCLEVLLSATSNNDVVNLQHHSAELGSQHELLSLSNQWIDDESILHVVRASLHAVDTQSRVLLGDLSGLDAGKGGNWGESGVLGQGHWDLVKSLGESAHGILLKAWRLDGGILDGEGAGNLSSSTSIDDTVITNQVANDAKSIVQGTLSLVDNLVVCEQ